jgi:flagellin
MALVISTNLAAQFAARNLEKNNDALTNSLNKLSSGHRINRPNDDAGGMSVQLKMLASIHRGRATKNNIQNAISLLQTQDGVLQTAVKIVDRIGELKTMATDSTKNSGDLQNYNEEYQQLRAQLLELQSEEFNGIGMFMESQGSSDSNLEGVFTVYTSERGDSTGAPSVNINGVHLANGTDTTASVSYSISDGLTADVSSMTSGGIASTGLTMDGILSDLQNLANARAENGALQSRLGYSYDQVATTKDNMTAARSRIVDVDIAEESSNFARLNILTQAASSVLSQANSTAQTALRLLMA